MLQGVAVCVAGSAVRGCLSLTAWWTVMPRSAGDSGTRSRRGKRRDGGGGGRHRTPTVADGGGAGGDGGDASKQRRTVEPSPWAPELRSAFTMLLIARGFAVFTTAISDCDETFNYWEPLHYLMYGRGLQTWEYRYVASKAMFERRAADRVRSCLYCPRSVACSLQPGVWAALVPVHRTALRSRLHWTAVRRG